MSSILWQPAPGPQTEFLATTAREVLYGGAVGGGKSEALKVMPLRWAAHPKLRAIYLRRRKDDCREMIDRVRELYPQIMHVPSGYGWHETEFRYRFPAGGFLQFGYADIEREIERYKTDEFNLIMWDELTEWSSEYPYLFMLTRNRAKANDLPTFVRAATNPNGPGMDWVDRRFMGSKPDGSQLYAPYVIYDHEVEVEGMGTLRTTRQFIPSTVFDNPYLPNREAYIAGVANLPDAEREAMLYGRWGRFRGQYFKKAPRSVQPGIKREENGDWYVVRCVDYGWSDPTCVLWLVVYENGVVEVAAEVYERQLTTDSIVTLGDSIEGELGLGAGNRRLRYSVLSPDAFVERKEGAPSIAHSFGVAGWWFTRANNSRISGWHQIARLIEQDRLRVWEGRAPNLMRTLTKLPHDPNDPRDVKRRHIEDHAPEALRYGCMTLVEAPEGPGPEHREMGSRERAHERNRDPFFEEWQRQAERALRGGGERVEGLGVGW